MKKVPLTQGLVALVDDGDFDMLMQHKWHADTSRGGPRAKRNASRVKGEKPGTIYMHRQIMQASPGIRIDHADHNTLNNQRGNLRVCTRAKNQQNRYKQEGCSSKFKGVCWDRSLGRWRVRITVDGRQLYVGVFADEVLAALAYNAAAVEHFKEFALPNEI